jgi:hypothetical protein
MADCAALDEVCDGRQAFFSTLCHYLFVNLSANVVYLWNIYPEKGLFLCIET